MSTSTMFIVIGLVLISVGAVSLIMGGRMVALGTVLLGIANLCFALEAM